MKYTSVASYYKQGYGNNEHVATAWLLSVELKCWFLAQLVSSTLLNYLSELELQLG